MTPRVDNQKTYHGNNDRLSRREQLVEVSVFLFLIIPSLVLSFFAIKQGSLGFVLVTVSVILRDLALVSLILFFIWRNGEPIDWIGWTVRRGWQDIILGIVLFFPLAFGASLLEDILLAIGLSSPPKLHASFLTPRGTAESVLAIVLVVVVAFAEETIFRGYLMLRLKRITASSAAAVVLSAVIFSLGHGYEGSAGVITVGAMGAAYALVYLWRQSLVAPMVMHFLQDFISIVLQSHLR